MEKSGLVQRNRGTSRQMSAWRKSGILQGEKVGYCYPIRLEKTLCKWDILIYVPLVTKGVNKLLVSENYCFKTFTWRASVSLFVLKRVRGFVKKNVCLHIR